jgi:hypothetical protein
MTLPSQLYRSLLVHPVLRTCVASAFLIVLVACEKPVEPYYAHHDDGVHPSHAESGAHDHTHDAPHLDASSSIPLPLPLPDPSAAQEAMPASGARELSGRVLETYDSDAGAYSYVRVELAEGGEAWIAGPLTALAPGQLLLARNATLQLGFKTRQRTFEELWLAQTIETDAATQLSPRSTIDTNQQRRAAVTPASGGLSIADVRARAKELAGSRVRVRGQVTRVTPMVGGLWVHLSDGSAEAAHDDLTFILKEGSGILKEGSGELAPDAIVTLEGTLSLDHEMARAHRKEAIVVVDAEPLR